MDVIPPKKVSPALVFLALIVIQIGFGGYGIVLKKFAQNHKIDAVIFSMLRDGFCFPVLLVAAMVVEKKLVLPTWSELPLMASFGLTGMFGNQLLYILGLYNTTPDIASIYQPAIPVWTALFVIILRVEPFPPLSKLRGWLKILGILAAAGGAVVMVTSKSDSKKEKNAVLGNIFLIGNTVCMGLYVVIQKIFVFNRDSRWIQYPVHLTAWSYLFGAIFMCIASLYFVGRHETDKFKLNHYIIAPVFYAVFISSALCYGLITWANKQVSAMVVTAFWPLQVVVTVILSLIVFHQSINAQQIGGAVMIVLALIAVSLSNHMEEKEKEEEVKYQALHSQPEYGINK
eukprot:m.127267 g.127267  ORF g.127267 m.127267 type:complete len:344 (+) comp23536_c0_seq2:77-1108(+)